MRSFLKRSPHAIPVLLPALILLFLWSTSFAEEVINVGTDSSTQAEAETPGKADSKNPEETQSDSAVSASAGSSFSTSTESAALLLSSANTLAQTGAATYSIPIEVPPGRADMAPNLVFRNNSYQ